MELRVMILDDEYIILDGLASFPWEEFGCQVTALAKNGLEGMEKLEEAAPDLILSDVKMPGMDGLEFSEKARERYPDVTIVILTGYDSFTYAKQAIRIGVKEYLLKPIDYDVMKETVGRIAEEIRGRKKRQRHFQDLQKYFNSSLPELRSKFAANLLYGRIQGKNEMQAQEATLNLHIEKYIVCVGRKLVDEGRAGQCDKWIEEFACINIFEEIFDKHGIKVLSDYNTATTEYNFLLMYDPDDTKCMDKATEACGEIQKEAEHYLNCSMNFGLSEVASDPYEANIQYRRAQKTCRQCSYLGTNIILKYEDLSFNDQWEFVLTTGEKSRFMMTLFQGNFEKVEEELRLMFGRVQEEASEVKFAAMDLLLDCMKFPYTCAVEGEIQNRNWNLSILQDGVKRIAECGTTEEILECLLKEFEMMIKQNTEGADERNMKLVSGIQSYIDKNYSNDLSMDDLTERFHVSRTYISRLLKKYTGQSFLEYLTDVRFRHVEELIASNKYKQYEIAEMVGYKDFGYYIKVFKKRYGITPNEFKKHI